MTAPIFSENTKATLSIPTPEVNGSRVAVQSVGLTLLDEIGVVIAPFGVIAVATPANNAATVTVEIPASYNDLAADKKRGARVVQVRFTTASGVYETETIYLVEKAAQIERLKNSFVSSAEALMLTRELVNLDGWTNATDDERNAALVMAHANLCKLTYRYSGTESQSRITWGESAETGYTYVTDIDEITEDEWNSTPESFRLALQRAQIVEADNFLRGDPVGDKRRAGIVSETIGESSMFFKNVPDVRLAVCREALDYLAGYIVRTVSVARG